MSVFLAADTCDNKLAVHLRNTDDLTHASTPHWCFRILFCTVLYCTVVCCTVVCCTVLLCCVAARRGDGLSTEVRRMGGGVDVCLPEHVPEHAHLQTGKEFYFILFYYMGKMDGNEVK